MPQFDFCPNFSPDEIKGDTNELLQILQEELAECIQACSKIIRFGNTPDNANQLSREIADCLTLISLLNNKNSVNLQYLEVDCQVKIDKLKVYSSIFGKPNGNVY